MLAAVNDAVDRGGRAAHHHQLGPGYSQAIVHGHLGPSHVSLLRQVDHVGIVDEADDLRAVIAQQPSVDVVRQQRGIGDDGPAHLDQPANVGHRRGTEVDALGERRVLGLFLDFFQNARYIWVDIWGCIAVPAVRPL